MSEWYKDLTAEELEGKHVRVVASDGSTVCGRLNRTEQELYVAPKTSLGMRVFIVGTDETIKDQGIRSVSSMWDERDFEQITFEDIPQCGLIGNSNYYAVINSFREQIAKVGGNSKRHPMVYLSGGALPVPAAFVSDFLRRKQQVPSESGFYRDKNGTIWNFNNKGQAFLIQTNSPHSDGFWKYVSSMGNYAPFTPVHFEDGPAESKETK